ATASSPLSLHDALPISSDAPGARAQPAGCAEPCRAAHGTGGVHWAASRAPCRRIAELRSRRARRLPFSGKPLERKTVTPNLKIRSEEHTSELQSRENLV